MAKRSKKKSKQSNSSLRFALIVAGLAILGYLGVSLTTQSGIFADLAQPASINYMIVEDAQTGTAAEKVAVEKLNKAVTVAEKLKGKVSDKKQEELEVKVNKAAEQVNDARQPDKSKDPIAPLIPTNYKTADAVVTTTNSTAANSGSGSCAGGFGASIPAGTWAPTGGNIEVDGKDVRACVKCSETGRWESSQACSLALATDPAHTLLPKDAGQLYTGLTYTLPNSCYKGGSIYPSGANVGKEYCSNGSWRTSDQYKKDMVAFCVTKGLVSQGNICVSAPTPPAGSGAADGETGCKVEKTAENKGWACNEDGDKRVFKNCGNGTFNQDTGECDPVASAPAAPISTTSYATTIERCQQQQSQYNKSGSHRWIECGFKDGKPRVTISTCELPSAYDEKGYCVPMNDLLHIPLEADAPEAGTVIKPYVKAGTRVNNLETCGPTGASAIPSLPGQFICNDSSGNVPRNSEYYNEIANPPSRGVLGTPDAPSIPGSLGYDTVGGVVGFSSAIIGTAIPCSVPLVFGVIGVVPSIACRAAAGVTGSLIGNKLGDYIYSWTHQQPDTNSSESVRTNSELEEDSGGPGDACTYNADCGDGLGCANAKGSGWALSGKTCMTPEEATRLQKLSRQITPVDTSLAGKVFTNIPGGKSALVQCQESAGKVYDCVPDEVIGNQETYKLVPFN